VLSSCPLRPEILSLRCRRPVSFPKFPRSHNGTSLSRGTAALLSFRSDPPLDLFPPPTSPSGLRSRCRSPATITPAVIASERRVAGNVPVPPVQPRTSQIRRLIAPPLSLSARAPRRPPIRAVSIPQDAVITARAIRPSLIERDGPPPGSFKGLN